MSKTLEGKKIAMIIAFREFRDIEYFIPKNILAGAGARIITCSSQKGIAIGADGGEVRVDILAKDLVSEEFDDLQRKSSHDSIQSISSYDAVVFIGGQGMAKKLDDEVFQQIAKDTVAKDKILGAICIAPALLAKTGVLTDKRATVWSNSLDRSAIKILTEEGAKYVAEDVVVDGKIVTAVGPSAAKKFGEALVEALTEK